MYFDDSMAQVACLMIPEPKNPNSEPEIILEEKSSMVSDDFRVLYILGCSTCISWHFSVGLLFPSSFLNQFGVGLRFHQISKALNEMRNMCGSRGETVGHRPLPYQQSPLTSSCRFYEVQSQVKGCVSNMLEDVVLFCFFGLAIFSNLSQ